jgi:hypothetical protein
MVKITDIYRGVPGGWKGVDPETKAPQEGNSYRNLKYAWIAHRRANDLPVGEVEAWIHQQICKRAPDYCTDGELRPKNASRDKEIWGPAMWEELHKKAVSGDLTIQWMTAWEQSLPSFGCKCRDHWKEVKKENPFQASFEWTFTAHNAVNRKLGKPLIPLDKATSIWSK